MSNKSEDGLVIVLAGKDRRVSFSMSPEVYDRMMEKTKADAKEADVNRSKAFERLILKALEANW